jgi:hypothetical protein
MSDAEVLLLEARHIVREMLKIKCRLRQTGAETAPQCVDSPKRIATEYRLLVENLIEITEVLGDLVLLNKRY